MIEVRRCYQRLAWQSETHSKNRDVVSNVKRLSKSDGVEKNGMSEERVRGNPMTRRRERLSMSGRLTPPAPRIYKTAGTRPVAVPHEVGAARMRPLLSAWKYIRVPLRTQALSRTGNRCSIAA